MTAIADYFEQAQLSQAAYALNLLRGMSGSNQTTDYINSLMTAGMSSSQAEEFANTYAVLDQYTDPTTGLSATVFHNVETGEVIFAIRGTEWSLQDWIGANFGDIGADGIAIGQGISLYNYLQRLLTPEGELAPQVEYVPAEVEPITNDVIPASVQEVDPAEGLGYLVDAIDITVTGHSLGGHLAMMMSRFAQGLVGSVYTYNAPGFGVVDGDNGFFDLLEEALIAPSTGSISPTWNPDIMSHVNVKGDVVHAIPGYYTPGTQQIAFSESANQDPLDSHSIKALTDALRVQSLFSLIAPNVTLAELDGILKASSNEVSNTLEIALDSLRGVFHDYVSGSPDATVAVTDPNDRDALYTNAQALENYIEDLPFYDPATGSLNFAIDSLVGRDATVLAASAETDIATRYALYKLNPYVIGNAGVVYSAINSGGALDLYDQATGTGNLTPAYLEDRAAFLTWKMYLNRNDNYPYDDPQAYPYPTSNYFQDRTSGYDVKLAPYALLDTQPIEDMH